MTGIYAPRRAGDVAGPVLVRGADADMMPASDRVTVGQAVWATISAIASISPEARRELATVGREPIAAAGRLAVS